MEHGNERTRAVRHRRACGAWLLAAWLWLGLAAGAWAQSAISLSPATLPDGVVGTVYSQAVTASGGVAPYTYTLGGSLPPGLSLDPASGAISGTPSVAGAYPFTITAADDLGIFATAAYQIDVAAAPLVVTPSTLPDGRVGDAYAAVVAARGGLAPYTFAVGSGALPAGLSLDAATGAIAGTPLADGTFAFSIVATDANGRTGDRAYSVDILPPLLSLAPATLPDATVGVAYGQVVTVVGPGTPPYAFTVAAGALPPGLSMTPSGADAATIAGTPLTPGSYGFTLQAEDGAGHVATQAYTVVVAAPAIVLSPASLPDGQVGAPYAQALSASGGTAPYAFALASGALPPGLALASGGALSGTPATAGNYAFSVAATDALGSSGTRAYVLVVGALPPPSVAAHHATTPMETPVQVALAEGAGGGPFTAADVLSLSPANAGTTSVAASGADYVLTYTPAPGFLGTATVQYTLSNAGGPSAPGTVTIEVVPRPDPLADAEVAGLAQAQAAIAQVFAQTQVTNVVQRLERLQEPGTGRWGFWVAGAFRRGDLDADGRAEGLAFETSGVTTGADRRFGERFTFGVAGGLGQDRTLVGHRGSRSDSRAHATVGYGSFHAPGSPFFVNALHGHQRLSFDLRRFVPADGDPLESERTGGQDFSSLGAGYRHAGKAWTFTSYGRQDDVRTRLDPYTEPGGTRDALHYDAQEVRTRTSILGFRADGRHEIRWGTLLPKLKLELQRDANDPGEVAVRYADQPDGPVYRERPRRLDDSRVALELGATLVTRRFLTLRLEYHAMLGGLYRNDNAIVFSFEKEH